MKLVLAVSGGVDSVVMLDLAAKHYSSGDILVAHFNHGIRENSAEDARFVGRLAKQYGLEFTLGEAKLGAGASEVKARTARYEFLRGLSGEIYTAHHLDDLTGTAAINLVRGTGWRGLAGLDSPDIKRPFLTDWKAWGFSAPPDKRELLRYAGEHHLCFREDQSNSSDEYLRNRLYHQMNNDFYSIQEKIQLYDLWQQQLKLKKEIDQLIEELLPDTTWRRSWFRDLDDDTALELLRAGLEKAGVSTTRPQRQDFLRAIREYKSGKCFNLPEDRLIRFSKTEFVL